jgi:hypothetical protein
MSLIRIVSQTGQKQTKSIQNVKLNLFVEYGAPPTLYVMVQTSSGPERRMKNLLDVTLAEAERYVAEHRKPAKTTPKSVGEMARLAKDFKKSGAKPNDRIGGWLIPGAKKSNG